MCGIFGYIGSDNHAALKTLRGLKDLEYRGYDSWGIAVRTEHGFYCKKAVGKISAVADADFAGIAGQSSLGHTRWATHGGVTEKNAHPHFNQARTIAVVHNGIVENYLELKRELARKLGSGLFRSETDTEVIPHLLDMYMRGGLSLENAFLRTCRRLSGRFAFVVQEAGADYALAARNGSPLVIGKGDGEYFIASDIPAFLSYTRKLYFVEDGEWARVSPDGVSFGNFMSGVRVRKKTITSPWNKEAATKAGWKHFMLKEIMEQKESLVRVLRQDEAALSRAARAIRKSSHVVFVGCGTAGHVGILGEYIFSAHAGKNARFVYASEFRRELPFVTDESVVIPITQSGETADVLEAVKAARQKGARIISILNARGSSVERASDLFFPIDAGPEIAVASTKAATGQIAALYLLAFAAAMRREEGARELARDIRRIGRWLTENVAETIQPIARRIAKSEHLYLIGKAEHFPVALEAALKIKEVSYIHAEGLAAAELKHGTIALIEKGTPCVAFVPEGDMRNDALSSIAELKARGAQIIGISTERSESFDEYVALPKTALLSPVASIIAAQLIAYYCALARGHDPDKPRNLAKSVTVK
ncbi:MAG: glutamine--fructose-6-phosphate transaminase (isomerizing) [Parcubacteria group bacterium]|nr:glutamine--fructose-6-phosphate transaminase (isomerizing) [Parcubacteria group bacterium]